MYRSKEITKTYLKSGLKWNEIFELPDESYSISHLQNYLGYINKKHETVTDNPPIRMYVNKIENKITFEVKAEYYLCLK